MSTGAPKDYLNPNPNTNPSVREIGGLAVRSSIDVCKGCRKCCGALIKTIAQNRLATAIVISLPMLAMSVFLIYIETSLASFIHTLPSLNIPAFQQYKLVIFSPFYTLAGITYGFGLLAMLAIRCEWQNLIRFSAFVYRGIAHWLLLSIFLLFIPIAGYLPLYIIFQISSLSLLPAALWLFTAGVMTGHSDLITAAIEGRNQATHQIDATMMGP
jgi:hypothetical protein